VQIYYAKMKTQDGTENVQNRELQELVEPKPTKAWLDAARSCAKIPLGGDQHQPRFVPLIDVITGVASERKAKEFVAVWRIIRLPWLGHVFMEGRPPQFATRKAWKSFVAGTFSAGEIQPTNEISIARINFAEFLGLKKVLTLRRESYSFLKEEVPGPVDAMITVDMVREAVRELADLNFLYDMFEIEYRRTYDPPDQICRRMTPIAGNGNLTFPVPVPRSKLSDRAAWLITVRDFMVPWPGSKPPSFDVQIPNPPTLGDVRSLESAVAEVYCSNVTLILRRRPVLPRYL